MKAFSKLGPGMVRTPEEAYASEAPWDTPAVREPAPAGALQRNYPNDFPETEDDVREPIDEKPYVSPRARVGFRVRGALRSPLGRVVVGTVALGILGVTGAVAWSVHRFLLHDERFVIPSSTHIETSGNVHLTRAQLLSVFGEDVERNIFRVPLSQRRADLENLTWVQHATVMRLLPNTLRISVEERKPVAFFRQGTHMGLVDASGTLLDMAPTDVGDPHYSFPVLLGISSEDPISTRAARMELYRKFMEDVDGGGEKLSMDISEVDVTNPDDVKVLPASSTVLVHLGDEEFRQRYQVFRSHLDEWKQHKPNLFAVDMRYKTSIVLEPEPGTVFTSTDAVAANTPPPSPASAKTADRLAPAAKAPTVKTTAVKAPAKPVVTAAKAETHAVKAETHAPKAEPRPDVKPARGGAHPANASGVSPANAKMFAALAAARKAQMEQSKQGPR